MNRRGNQKYLHYENVRNRFAKDVGFNYRRGDSYSNRDNYRDERNQNKRERYDDRKIDYHRSGDRLKWDESRENRTGEIYGGRRARRDLESICEDNKKRQKLSENNNSNSCDPAILDFPQEGLPTVAAVSFHPFESLPLKPVNRTLLPFQNFF